MNDSAELLKKKMNLALSELKEAVDLTAELKLSGPDIKAATNLIWEQFLFEFFNYIKQKSKETKQNILAGIKFPRF